MNYLTKANQSAVKPIRDALKLYNDEQYTKALESLSALLAAHPTTVDSATAYSNRGAIAPNPIAWVQWVEEAIVSLRKLTGEDVISVTPVPLALNTALSLLPNPRNAGRKPDGDKPKVTVSCTIPEDLRDWGRGRGDVNFSELLTDALEAKKAELEKDPQ